MNDNNLDTLVANSVRNFTRVVPFFHSLIVFPILDGRNLYDCVVSDNVDDPDHLFRDAFEVKDVPTKNGNNRPHNLVTIWAEHLNIEPDEALKQLLFVPGDHDQVELTAAWVRYFSNFMSNLNGVDDPESAAALNDRTIGDQMPSPERVVAAVFEKDPALLHALHEILHLEDGYERLHGAIKLREVAAYDNDFDHYYTMQQAVKDYYVPARDYNRAAGVMQLLALIEAKSRDRDNNFPGDTPDAGGDLFPGDLF